MSRERQPGPALEEIRAALAREGLFIVEPVSQNALDRAGVALRLSHLLPGHADDALSGLVIGDGGGGFFARFAAHADRDRPEPLDHHTAIVIPGALHRALGSEVPMAVRYPFDAKTPPLPMQAIGQAAGLPAPGPLGIQIHPRFGPWWAYRALVVLPLVLPDAPAMVDSCAGCPAPCVSACPGQAVRPQGFEIVACAQHRLQDPGCHHTCVARRACVVAQDRAYGDEQLGFHMAASLVSVRRYFRV